MWGFFSCEFSRWTTEQNVNFLNLKVISSVPSGKVNEICVLLFVTVEVNDGLIVSVTRRREAPKTTEKGPYVVNYGNAVIMPGLIDMYVSRPLWFSPSLSLQQATGSKSLIFGDWWNLVYKPVTVFPQFGPRTSATPCRSPTFILSSNCRKSFPKY